MSTANQLAPKATARLLMTEGIPCSIAEFAMYLDQYDYAQANDDERRWHLNEAESLGAPEPCAIVVNDLNAPVEVIDVYGEGSEHYTNLNYLMQRAGWKSCAVICRSDDVSAKMLARFVSVEISSDITLPASSLDANQPAEQPASGPTSESVPTHTPALPGAEQVMFGDDAGGAETLAELEMANQRVRELTIQLNAAQEMQSALESENTLLRERVQDLQGRPAPSADAEHEPVDARQLMRIIEEYLLPSVDISSTGSSRLLADLRTAGYGVQLRLVRAGSQ